MFVKTRLCGRSAVRLGVRGLARWVERAPAPDRSCLIVGRWAGAGLVVEQRAWSGRESYTKLDFDGSSEV